MNLICLHKFRDSRTNNIVGYRVKEKATGAVFDVKATLLKQGIKTGKYNVENLKLTANGRLVGTSTNDKYKEIVALGSTILEKMNLSNSYKDNSENGKIVISYYADIKYKDIFTELELTYYNETDTLFICLVDSDRDIVYEVASKYNKNDMCKAARKFYEHIMEMR